MSYDPLSDPTRRARRSLLGLSALALVSEISGLTISEIPLMGINIEFANDFLPTFFFIGIAYFLVTFLVYQLDDRVNAIVSPSQERFMAKRRSVIAQQVRQLHYVVRDHYGEPQAENLSNMLLVMKDRPDEAVKFEDQVRNELGAGDEADEVIAAMRSSLEEILKVVPDSKVARITWARVWIWEVAFPATSGVIALLAITGLIELSVPPGSQ